MLDELPPLLVGGAEVLPLFEEGSEIPSLGDDIGEAEVVSGAVIVATLEQGVVGWAVTQAQREPAEASTAPTEAPQLLITQF